MKKVRRRKLIPQMTMEKLIRKYGEGSRASEGAGIELSDTLEEYGSRITKKARMLANHAGRKTIRKEDIRFAVKRVK